MPGALGQHMSHAPGEDGPMIQQIPYRVGSKVRVYPVNGGYALPDGLPAGTRVTVVSMEAGIRVVEFEGRRFTVPMACINSGFRVLRPPRMRTQDGPGA